MTSLQTFLKSKNTDVFLDIDSGNEYSKDDLDAGFQEVQSEGAITIQEYYDRLIAYLKGFRKSHFSDLGMSS